MLNFNTFENAHPKCTAGHPLFRYLNTTLGGGYSDSVKNLQVHHILLTSYKHTQSSLQKNMVTPRNVIYRYHRQN